MDEFMNIKVTEKFHSFVQMAFFDWSITYDQKYVKNEGVHCTSFQMNHVYAISRNGSSHCLLLRVDL